MKLVKCVSLLVLCALTSACLTTDGQKPNLLTTEEEVAIGEKVSKEIEAKEKILDDPAMQAYMRTVGAHLAAFAPRQDVEYRFTVIDNPETINAFALPGGHMYVYTGLLRLCGNEAELASVMAHEISHVACYHHGESLTRQYGYALLMGILLGEEPSATAQLVAQLVGTLGTMKFSRQDEREADQMGMRILFQGGYKPEAMVSFMNKMIEENARKGGANPPKIFSSHPPTAERMQYLNEMVQTFPSEYRANNVLNEARYKTNVLARLD